MTSVSIIILNWNGWKDTIECLESLYRINYPNYEVIVVDNGSTNNSVEMIKKWADGKKRIESSYFKYNPHNKPIKYYMYTRKELESGKYLSGKKKLDNYSSNKKLFILQNDKNYGFAEGNNIAIKQIIKEKQSKYILLLNNDTVVEYKFLNNLIKHIANKSVGIVGSRNKYYSDPKKDWYAGGRFYYYLGGLINLTYYKNCNKTIDVDYVSGSSLLIKTSILNNKNMYFDRSYFCYYDDIQLCYEAKRYGFKVKYVPNSVIYHKVGKSAKNSEKYMYLNTRNRIWFVKRSFNIVQNIVFFLSYFICRFPIGILRSIRSKTTNVYLKGVIDGYFT